MIFLNELFTAIIKYFEQYGPTLDYSLSLNCETHKKVSITNILGILLCPWKKLIRHGKTINR